VRRSHTCGELHAAHVGTPVTLVGWVHRRRTHGGLTFLDLRDRYGLIQVVANAEESSAAHAAAEDLRSEYVISVRGAVARRPEGTTNPGLATGEVEVRADAIEILNSARTPPFEINQESEIDENLRLRHRYLDLRRERMRDILLSRHRLARTVRDHLDGRGFVEVETPILVARTPGGAREFLVPSRLSPGSFYALPQSPQQYKQLLMVAGLDRYYQIARCFRDEDPRADRAPEFTQIDIEMSFIEQEDILALFEDLALAIVRAISPDRRLREVPFPRMTFQEAMDRYGTDKPDLRFAMEIVDLTDAVPAGFPPFDRARAEGGVVRAILAPGCAGYSRRELDELVAFARARGASGLVTLAVADTEIRGPLNRFFDPQALARFAGAVGGAPGDLILLVAEKASTTSTVLGDLRSEMGRRLGLADPDELAFCWVLDMPAFEWDEKASQYVAKHHQFTAPAPDDLPLLETNPSLVRAQQYDCVCNGYELAGGSIRIHRRDIQERIFRVLGMTDDEARARFGHMLEAFEYGTPPHGGIASGVDRWLMILAGASSLRETFAFPKTQSGLEPMTGAPAAVSEADLDDIHIRPRLPAERT